MCAQLAALPARLGSSDCTWDKRTFPGFSVPCFANPKHSFPNSEASWPPNYMQLLCVLFPSTDNQHWHTHTKKANRRGLEENSTGSPTRSPTDRWIPLASCCAVSMGTSRHRVKASSAAQPCTDAISCSAHGTRGQQANFPSTATSCCKCWDRGSVHCAHSAPGNSSVG